MDYGMNPVNSGGLFCSAVGGDIAPSTGEEKHNHDEQVIRQCDVTVHDVLLGRGRGPNMHPGNQRYREIIYANRDNYNKASNRTEQTRITREIVNHIKQNGRFLKRLETPKSQKKKKKRGSSTEDAWVVVSDATARLKVGQCLRYKLRQDAEQHDDGSMGEDCREEKFSHSTEKYSGGAIIPPIMEKKLFAPGAVNANVVEAEPIVSGQPSRKYRKVEVPEEPALDAEELQVLKAFKAHGMVQDDEDEDSLDGFLESPLWEAKGNTEALYVEDEPEPQGSLMGGYYDTMFGNAGSYDSNFAYGTGLISDAEVLTALGYPQPPPQPSSRPAVLCYCGCRINPSEAHKHKCVPGQGIFSMPCASPSGNWSAPRNHNDVLMSEPQEEPIRTIIAGGNDDNMVNMNNNTNTSLPMVIQSNDTMTKTMNPSNAWDGGPIQSGGTIQSVPPGMSSGPFHVPDSAPALRPRMYRPFMQNVT
eukprot:scaffold34646_cov173-Amphora_coffeaeformis.AAC.9